ncbi:hypothetical protein E8M12_13010 [Thalassotalea mangrovi]|uniref:Uncharacterized protein n=1 Tax=Thalassotalea mangrovi TaxID=2572245 RepID=A0A4U1B316_9GAMM|nr:hypothetical protein E8M12_13010 [Thalassotalea mangrovi]
MINFVYKGDRLHFSGGYWGDNIRGIELGIPFYDIKHSYLTTINATVGHTRTEDSMNDVDEWTYVGVSTTIDFNGFYIEPGLTIGKGDYDSPQLSLQLGYLW